jgi:hypothetical protein
MRSTAAASISRALLLVCACTSVGCSTSPASEETEPLPPTQTVAEIDEQDTCAVEVQVADRDVRQLSDEEVRWTVETADMFGGTRVLVFETRADARAAYDMFPNNSMVIACPGGGLVRE